MSISQGKLAKIMHNTVSAPTQTNNNDISQVSVCQLR